eukprot:2099014-Rhodomonas_salina.2
MGGRLDPGPRGALQLRGHRRFLNLSAPQSGSSTLRRRALYLGHLLPTSPRVLRPHRLRLVQRLSTGHPVASA